MLTYTGNDKNFQTKINQYNHSIALFLNPQVSDKVRSRIFQNLVNQLNSIHENHPDGWLEENKKSANSDVIGLIHLREILCNCNAINSIVTDPNFPQLSTLGQDYIKQLKELTDTMEKEVLIKENELNRTYKNTVLNNIEFGASVLFLAGTVSLGVGGILYAGGYLTCTPAALKYGKIAVKAGGAAIGGGFAGFVVKQGFEDPEPNTLRNFTN